MNQARRQFSRRSGERGQTIILVAVSLVSLLAMAALAIDVVTLYVARGEMQRAADAAALAGAKAFVDSGVTQRSGQCRAASPGANHGHNRDQLILPQNKISGARPDTGRRASIRLHPCRAIRRSPLPCKEPICRLSFRASGERDCPPCRHPQSRKPTIPATRRRTILRSRRNA